MRIFLCVAYLAVISVLSHVVGELLPRKWFREDQFPFRTFAWENGGKLYEKLKIKKWKTKVPDLSKIFKYMVPKRVVSYNDAKSSDFEELVKETCVAELIHTVNCVISFFVIFIAKNIVGVIFYVLYVLGNLPFILIQRYNRPHLLRVKEKMALRETMLKNT